MSGGPLPTKRSREIYECSRMSKDVRNALGAVAETLVVLRNFSQEDVRDVFREASFDVPRSTLSDWLHRIDSTGEAVPLGSGVGSAPLLDAFDLELLAGFILHKNFKCEEVHLQTVVTFLRDELGVVMQKSTACEYLKDLGFSRRDLVTRKKSYMRQKEDVGNRYYRWLVRHRISAASFLVCSLDFTYTTHRTRKVHGYARVGAVPPEVSDSTPSFTNCVVTCIWADGVNRTPCVLFTYDALFRSDRHPLAK